MRPFQKGRPRCLFSVDAYWCRLTVHVEGTCRAVAYTTPIVHDPHRTPPTWTRWMEAPTGYVGASRTSFQVSSYK